MIHALETSCFVVVPLFLDKNSRCHYEARQRWRVFLIDSEGLYPAAYSSPLDPPSLRGYNYSHG